MNAEAARITRAAKFRIIPAIHRPACVRYADPDYEKSCSKVGEVTFPTYFRHWEPQQALEEIFQAELITLI